MFRRFFDLVIGDYEDKFALLCVKIICCVVVFTCIVTFVLDTRW